MVGDVLKKLRAKLASLTHSRGIQVALRDRATARMHARHVGQKKAEVQARAAREQGDRFRREAHRLAPDDPAKARKLRRAERKGRKAGKLDVKAEREKTRAVFWRGRARTIAKRIEGVEDRLDQIEEQIARSGATVQGNHVKGGDEFERWMLCLNTMAANCMKGLPDGRRNFYDMGGSWNVDHPIHPGEAPGERSDCSQGQTSAIKACGFPDINGEDFRGGFTGTMLRASGRWKEVSLEHMLKARRPAVIVYGTGNGHHTEGWCPLIDSDGNYIDAMRTVGHGTAAWDAGTVYDFGPGEFQRYFILAAE